MPDRNDNQPDESDNAMLADGGSIETTSIGIIGGTAQVDVALPIPNDDDDFDDDVVDDGYVDEQAVTGDVPVAAAASGPVAVQTGPTAVRSGVADAPSDAVDEADAAATGRAVDTESSEPDSPADEDGDPADAAADVDVDVEAAAEAEIESDADAQADAADHDDDSAAAVSGSPMHDDIVDADVVGEPVAPAAASAARPAAGDVVATVVATTTPITGGVPASRRAAHQLEGERHASERVQVSRSAEVTLQSRRLGDLEPNRESSDLLTAERLLDPNQVVRAEPDGVWQRLVYTVTAHRVNLGDSKRARARKELDRRISAPLVGGARFVPVLSRKGGVGKTTVTTLLGMALADARDDRVIAIDANPDRGTLAERIGRSSGKTVRDLVRIRKDVVGFNDLSNIVARDETRLDVIASDTDPHVSEAFSDRDYHDVASIAAHYYSIVLTDTGTGIVHSVMGATLDLSDQLVVVAGMSVDEARLASETLTWLEANGFAEQVKNAVVVLNTSRPGTPLVRASELETHFSTRVKKVLRVPYDPHLAAGSTVSFRELEPATREAARQLAASVVEGLRLVSPAA